MTNRRIFVALVFLLGIEALFLALDPRLMIPAPAAIVPYLVPQGWIPYDSLTLQYPPGYLWLNMGLAAAIPNLEWRLRSANILLGWALTLLTYTVTQRWTNARAGWTASLYMAVWYLAIAANAFYLDALVGALVIAAFWQLRRPWIVGVLIACACLVKPQALLFLPLFALYYLWHSSDWERLSHSL